jgi:hypothetical protein
MKRRFIMGFMEDFRREIDTYDGEYVDVKLVAYQHLGPGSTLNVGEWFRFQIQVRNKGDLDMKNVSVLVSKTAFADVTLNYGSPGNYVSVSFGDINAHGSKQTSQWVYGYATRATEGAEKDVVTARIARWDASLDHVLKDHAAWGPREGKITVTIAPN